MSDSLQKKMDLVFRSLLHTEHEFCSFEELSEKVVFEENMSREDRFKAVVDTVCKYTINTKDNTWMAKLYGGGTEMSFIAEMIISYYNQNCHTYSSSPIFTFTEEQIINKMIGYVGYQAGASGLFLPGGSYCTLVGMICARYKKFPSSKKGGLYHPVQVITSVNSHYSVDKGAIMMGMGTDNVIKIDFEKTTPQEFEEIVVNNNVFMINSTFGTTCEGTIETVDKFSNILKKYNIWHHIDACVSGIALFSTKYRYLTASFKEADSITIDCHKCLNLNLQCSLLLVREGELLGDVSRITAPYLFHQDSEYDIANRSFTCGRRADGFKLWFCDQLDDLDAQATLIYDRNARFKKIIADDPRFIGVVEYSMTHTCFKLVTEKEVKIHEITAVLRREGVFIEYHNDFFRAVVVNDNIEEGVFKDILDRIIAVHQRLVD